MTKIERFKYGVFCPWDMAEESIELCITDRGGGASELTFKRGGVEETVGTFFPSAGNPQQYHFRNDALDLMCYVDTGCGHELLAEQCLLHKLRNWGLGMEK